MMSAVLTAETAILTNTFGTKRLTNRTREPASYILHGKTKTWSDSSVLR